MPGSSGIRPRRAKGSWIPRLAGIAVAAALTAGGLALYLGSQPPAQSPPGHHRHAAPLSSRIIKARAVGIVDFGPDDDKDAFAQDLDDHPLKLRPTRAGLEFVTISAAEMANGTPLWTANQMGDGNEIFIYTPTGRCLTAASVAQQVMLSRCTLRSNQRWRPVHEVTVAGQAIAAYSNESTKTCLTAPPPNPEGGPANPGAATLAPCGPARDRTQEIAFWWSP